MSEKAELRNMIMSFRVTELQMLLGVTSQSRCGRKTELLQRALQLLDGGINSSVSLKIRELYQRFAAPRSSILPAHSHASEKPKPAASTGAASGVHRGLSVLLNQHNGAAAGSKDSNAPVTTNYPEIRLKHLPFYDVLNEIIRLINLMPRNSAKQQEMRLSFCFTEEQVKHIMAHRSKSHSNNSYNYGVQVQMRFCALASAGRLADCFPTTVQCKVNGIIAPLPNPIPTNKPGAVPKRPGRPVDLTALCRLSTSVTNSVVISWTVEDNKNYCVAISLVRKIDSNELLRRLKKHYVLKPEQTKQIVKEKLSLDGDNNDLALTSLRISMLCPVGKSRMEVPCRVQTCDHVQCFDALNFLQMNEKKPTWMCPICDRPADFKQLCIDSFTVSILKECGNATEIGLTVDGKWFVASVAEEEKENDKEEEEDLPLDIIDLTGDDDDKYPYEPPTDSKADIPVIISPSPSPEKKSPSPISQSSSSSILPSFIPPPLPSHPAPLPRDIMPPTPPPPLPNAVKDNDHPPLPAHTKQPVQRNAVPTSSAPIIPPYSPNPYPIGHPFFGFSNAPTGFYPPIPAPYGPFYGPGSSYPIMGGMPDYTAGFGYPAGPYDFLNMNLNNSDPNNKNS